MAPIDISPKTCEDCELRNNCQGEKKGWVFIRGALVPFWGCTNIKLKNGVQTATSQKLIVKEQNNG